MKVITMQDGGKWVAGQQGFTLIELMVVVVVIAVLVAVGIPGYQAYLARGRHSEAVTTLLNLAQAQERFMLVHGVYAASLEGSMADGEGLDWNDERARHYQVMLNRANEVTYTLTAQPQGTQAANTLCASFTLTHTGQKGITGTGSVDDCW